MKSPMSSGTKIALGITAGVIVLGTIIFQANKKPSPIQTQTAKTTVTVASTLTSSKATLVPTTPTLAIPVGTDTSAPPTETVVSVPSETSTEAPGITETATETPVATGTSLSTSTSAPPTATSGATFTPFLNAPLCMDVGEFHNLSLGHGIFNSSVGCHYDHEHGEQDLFTSQAISSFGGLSFQNLLGGVQIGSSNPSSPCENAVGACGPAVGKHGGFKLQSELDVPHPCAIGFESATVGVKRALIQYHAFGNYAIEFESRIHSAAVLIAQCLPGNPNDLGYVFTIQHQEYGQRTSPYQGDVLNYPDNFQPAYASGFGPYLTIDCVGTKLAGQLGACRTSLSQILSMNLNATSKWTSKPTGSGARPDTPLLFRLLFDVRDTYQVLDWSDQSYPYTFLWVCGNTSYSPLGCKYNNSTSTVHEIVGDIPQAWDNLAGWDTDSRVGRVTVDGFVSRFGMPVAPGSCLIPGFACFPVKTLNAFVGRWGADLCVVKCSLMTPANSPEHDIFFLNGQVVSETTPGAVPSGWIGQEN